mmetsp:Transcript_11834/g.35645  ORF Transcript_11834/g.35645 Transcript_11834/m.35645 type:complete len:350 (+) Transcript_11834:208-1257(+)
MAAALTLLAGNASKSLAEGVAKALDRTELSEITVGKFANGETSVSIGVSVREADVFIIQSGIGDIPTNDAVMEMLILAHASRIASASRVTLVVPFFPYGKQNKIKNRGAIPSRMIADMMKVAGANHVITVDMNPAQMAGFFHIPVDNIMLWPLMTQYITSRIPEWGSCVLVAKNAGASKRASKLAKMLDIDMAMVIGRGEDDGHVAPESPMRPRAGSGAAAAAGAPEVAFKSGNVIGKVKERCCILVDDVLDEAEQFIAAAEALVGAGAVQVIVFVTHGILSGDAPRLLQDSPCISQVVVSNTVPQEAHQKECPKLTVIRCEAILAETIRRVHNDECMSSKMCAELELA